MTPVQVEKNALIFAQVLDMKYVVKTGTKATGAATKEPAKINPNCGDPLNGENVLRPKDLILVADLKIFI